MPFASKLLRDLHFIKHGHQFGAADAVEYERMADAFMSGEMSRDTKECRRPNLGDRLRFNYWNRHLGSASVAPEFIRTFYVVAIRIVNNHGSESRYFGWECGRISI